MKFLKKHTALIIFAFIVIFVFAYVPVKLYIASTPSKEASILSTKLLSNKYNKGEKIFGGMTWGANKAETKKYSAIELY